MGKLQFLDEALELPTRPGSADGQMQEANEVIGIAKVEAPSPP
jgi:hypothetical protein